jgi:hypothetical protein
MSPYNAILFHLAGAAQTTMTASPFLRDLAGAAWTQCALADFGPGINAAPVCSSKSRRDSIVYSCCFTDKFVLKATRLHLRCLG